MAVAASAEPLSIVEAVGSPLCIVICVVLGSALVDWLGFVN